MVGGSPRWPTPIASEASADDLLNIVFTELLQTGERTTPTKGAALDLFGARLELTDPRARLSRSERRGRVFSALGELCWYLAGTNDVEHIKYYLSRYSESAEDGIVWGAYGPRLFDFKGVNQIAYVCDRLAAKPNSRQTVVQLFDCEDVKEPHKDVPCTCTLQFLVRREHLQLVTYMRSNDAHTGLPHDLFAFTMLQEIVARTVGLEVGTYVHMVGSLHLYERDYHAAKRYLREGWHTRTPMPPMPVGDPWGHIRDLLEVESALRNGTHPSAITYSSSPYWADLERLLSIFASARSNDRGSAETIRQQMNSQIFDVFIQDRTDRIR